MEHKTIYQSAKNLTGNPFHSRLALISAGAIVAANILLVLLQMLIDHMMADSVGLAALTRRSVLMTAQGVLQLAVSLALPFWTFGFYRVALEIARKGAPSYSTLFAGFRRFGPLLRLLLLEWIMATGLMLLCIWLSTMAYMMTPFAEQVIRDITPALEAAETVTDPATLSAMMEPIMQEMVKDLWPLYLLIAVVLGVVLIPWFYKLRLAHFHVMDGENSALMAISLSKYEMHGNRFAMFKLDLCWWWYYGLQLLAGLPLYLYTYVGGGAAAMWITTLLSYGFQLLVEWKLLARVQTSYALAYDALKRIPETDVPPAGTPPQF